MTETNPTNSEKLVKLWMPLTKAKDGRTVGILSDTSIDRDNERMSKELIKKWAKTKSLPMLANHWNAMENFIGGWKSFKLIEKGSKSALSAEPIFFSAAASPLASQIEKQIQEAVDMGLNPGISIGALVKATRELDPDKEKGCRREWIEAELVEASFVPVQSNRNANYGTVAKQFNFDPDESAGNTPNKEGTKMPEDNNDTPPAQPPAQDPPKPEGDAAPKGDSETEKALKTENANLKTELEAQKTSVETLTKSVKDIGEKLDKAIKTPVNLPAQEEGAASGKQAGTAMPEAPTIESSLNAKFAPQTSQKKEVN